MIIQCKYQIFLPITYGIEKEITDSRTNKLLHANVSYKYVHTTNMK